MLNTIHKDIHTQTDTHTRTHTDMHAFAYAHTHTQEFLQVSSFYIFVPQCKCKSKYLSHTDAEKQHIQLHYAIIIIIMVIELIYDIKKKIPLISH